MSLTLLFMIGFLSHSAFASHCQLRLNTCTNYPTMYNLPVFTDQDYLIGTQSSNLNGTRCLERAKEYFNWCGNSYTNPATAIFYDDQGGTSQRTYPVQTKCEIAMLSCPAHPQTYVLPTLVDQDYLTGTQSSNFNSSRCLQRAQEYYGWCGSLLPVTATFSDSSGNRLSQVTYPSDFPTNYTSSVVIQETPAFPNLNLKITGTLNTWAPGSPRYVKNRMGAFAIFLRNTPRNSLVFDVQMRSGSVWQTIVPGLGAAVSDPVLLTDDWDRLHILFPANRNMCDSLHGPSNIIHIMVWQEGGVWKTQYMRTADIAPIQTCQGVPQTQRFGAAVHRKDQLLYLVYYDLLNTSSRHGFASFNLNTLGWNKAVSVSGSGSGTEGVGYAYIAPGANSGEVSFISTVYDQNGNYTRVDSYKSSNYGNTFSRIQLCNSLWINKTNCLTGDILLDSRQHTHMIFYADTKNGAYSPLTNTQFLPNRQVSYILSDHHWGVAFPIIDFNLGADSPSPHWNVSLNEVNGRLVAVGPYYGNRLGAWVSSDEGISWSFTDITPWLPDANRQPYQIMLYKPQWGGVIENTLMQGLYTDGIQFIDNVGTSEIKIWGF